MEDKWTMDTGLGTIRPYWILANEYDQLSPEEQRAVCVECPAVWFNGTLGISIFLYKDLNSDQLIYDVYDSDNFERETVAVVETLEEAKAVAVALHALEPSEAT